VRRFGNARPQLSEVPQVLVPFVSFFNERLQLERAPKRLYATAKQIGREKRNAVGLAKCARESPCELIVSFHLRIERRIRSIRSTADIIV